MKFISAVLLILCHHFKGNSQPPPVPRSYSQIKYDESKRLYFEKDGQKFYADTTGPRYTLKQLFGNPKGTEDGLSFDFGNLKGTFTYGLIPYGKAPHPLPVFRLTSHYRMEKLARTLKGISGFLTILSAGKKTKDLPWGIA